MKNFKEIMKEIMSEAWNYVRRNGYNMSEALKTAWANFRLRQQMKVRIVRFYFRKINGEIREAWGTLAENLIPATSGTDNRRKNDTVQVYYDTEKADWRCYKKANLLSIAA